MLILKARLWNLNFVLANEFYKIIIFLKLNKHIKLKEKFIDNKKINTI